MQTKQANQHNPNVNPYTKKPGKMIRISVFLWPEEKAKVYNEAKKSKHNSNASAVFRMLVGKLK